MLNKFSLVSVFCCVAGVAACGGPPTPAALVHDEGVIADYLSTKALAGMTISEGGLSTKTDAAGKWSLAVPTNVPLSPIVSGAKYTKILLSERILSANFNQQISVPDLDLFRAGAGGLTNYDATRGSVNVVVQPTATCSKVEGGTIKVKSPAGALVMYYAGLLPDSNAKAFGTPTGQNPVAVVYNVPAGAVVDLEITHPTCKQVPFPATEGGATYTGKVDVEVGDVSSVAFYFLK